MTAQEFRPWHAARGLIIACLLATSLGGCAILREFSPSVAVEPMSPGEYIALQRGDVLTTGQLSAQTAQAIRVSGLDRKSTRLNSSHT